MHISLQACIAVQVVVLGDAPAVRKNLGALGVFFGGDVAELLQQWDVHIGLDVAGNPGIPVPVPSTADVGRTIDQPDTFDTKLT
jgi:hypothetical protein